MERVLKVLIACEESQAECSEFRSLGHEAYSCDLQPCKRGGREDWHVCGKVQPLLRTPCEFTTMDGVRHQIDKWDLIVAHPPCTYLCKVSSVHMVKNGVLQQDRYQQMIKARKFFFECLNAKADHVAVENPLPMARASLPQPSFFADPSWFGDKYTKKTLYWVRDLPPLMAEIINPETKSLCRSSRGKYRSRTSPYLARALARQWSEFILSLPP